MNFKLKLLAGGLVAAIIALQPIYVYATQTFTESPGNSWISLNSTNNSKYLIHNSGDGNHLEFASVNAGVTKWQVLNINKNGTVSIGSTAINGTKFQVNSSAVEWAGTFKNTGADVRAAYPGHGIFVSTNSTGGEYLIQLNRVTTPIFQVNANGFAYLNGTLKVKELQVKANVWADNVFDENYELKSLNEVESFINENKHLPNIPSEKEVLENGINVSEMQAKQMEKIEELTLYVIEQQKEINELKDLVYKLSK